MDTKNIIVTIILVIILIVGGLWISIEYKPSIVEKKGDVYILLSDLKAQTGLNFSDIKDVEFKWQTAGAEIPVQGQRVEAVLISRKELESIGIFFTEKGFQANTHNISSGTISGMVGYELPPPEGESEFILCQFTGGISGYKAAVGHWIPQEPNLADVEIRCAKAEL